MTLYGIDASNHQGHMTGLADYPASFFVHKLTEGTTYTDPDAEHNLSMARRHRVPVLGGYHYLRHGDGVGEADYFAARARALFGHDLRGFLWQLDCEADATYRDVEAFKRRWDKGTHAPILFYTGDWWLRPRGWDVAALGFAGLWAAPGRGYVGKADRVRAGDWNAGYGGYRRLTICQYAARASLGDTNLYAGSLDQLKALTGGDDMPSIKDVWQTDGLIACPSTHKPRGDNDAYWWPQSFLQRGWDESHAANIKADEVLTQLAALSTAVQTLAESTGHDPERVYAAIREGSEAAVTAVLRPDQAGS